MTALLWATIRSRLGATVIAFVLAACAAAAAAAGPTYADAAGRAVTRTEVAAAPVNELTIRAGRPAPRDPGEKQPPLPVVDGVSTVFGRYVVGFVEPFERGDTVLTSRTGLCAHLILQSGRCAVADNEVVAREDMGRRAGEEFDFLYQSGGRRAEKRLTVVGVYRHVDVTDPFWAGHSQLFGVNAAGPLFTSEITLLYMRAEPLERVDLILGPDADPVAIRSDVESAMAQLQSGGYAINTDFPQLADRVQRSRDMLSAKLIGGVAPLVLICWFVLFFAISSAVRLRREELGLLALRGVPTGLRLALPTLEIAGPLLLGAMPGYLLGHMAVAVSYPDAGITGAAVIACGVAILGAIAAGVIALLWSARRKPARSVWLRALEIAVATIALAAGYQAALSGEEATGLSMLAPLGLTLGVGMLAARLLPAATARLGRAMLRRGRAAAALSLLALARRPGTAPIAILLTVVFGLAGHAAATVFVGAGSWEQRAEVQTGAARVLSVAPVSPGLVLDAVRAADPSGRHAMAVAVLARPDTPPILAVDSPRLAAIANWPDGPDEDLARRLRPAPPRPILLNSKSFTLTATMADPRGEPDVRLRLRVVTAQGSSGILEAGLLSPGTQKYELKDCLGCRLESLEIVVGFAEPGTRIELVLAELRDAQGKVVFDAGQTWHPVGMQVQGSRILLDAPVSNARLYPAVFTGPLPIAGSVAPPHEMAMYTDAVRQPVTDAGRLPLVPRIGRQGLLMDLEYAMHGTAAGGGATLEVWLAKDAPPEIVDRLRAAGLDIVGDRTAERQRAVLGEQAPAVAIRFVAIAAIAWLVLGLAGLLVAATLERGAPGLAVLRPQGVGEPMLRRAALGSRLVLLGFALVCSAAGFAVTWGVAYDIIPPFLDRSWPAAPLPPVVALLALPALIIAAIVCWAAARVSYVEDLAP